MELAVPDADLCALNVSDLGFLYRSRKVSPVEVTKAVLQRIERWNPELRAYISVLHEQGLASARIAEQQIVAGIDLGALQGVPIAVKDNMRVRGSRTTAASRVLADAPLDQEDATVVRRLRASGAILIGKLNLQEFARGEQDSDSPFSEVQNPRLLGHQAGSSSGGSAAAVAAGLAVITLGTDTGGSIRHPASVCGVVGLKPTYGLVPLQGVIPLSTSLEAVGPLGRTVADIAAALGSIAAHDPTDPTSILAPIPDYVGGLDMDLRGLRLGVPTNAFYRFGIPDALAALENGREKLIDLGLIPIPIELPFAEETNELSKLIIDVDLWIYHERFSDREAFYGRDFLNRSLPGLDTRAIDYARAKESQAEIRRRWLRIFERVDLLLLPGNAAGAPPMGIDTIEVAGESYAVSMVNSRFNRAANITGFPALVLPCGATGDGLPIALQLVGPPLSEHRLLAAAHRLEGSLGRLVSQWGVEPRRSSGPSDARHRPEGQ
jgi:aspartyl-tRNA(Asn)/glutamyl-tRNA(Gln) amidotransferase subunit A